MWLIFYIDAIKHISDTYLVCLVRPSWYHDNLRLILLINIRICLLSCSNLMFIEGWMYKYNGLCIFRSIRLRNIYIYIPIIHLGLSWLMLYIVAFYHHHHCQLLYCSFLLMIVYGNLMVPWLEGFFYPFSSIILSTIL